MRNKWNTTELQHIDGKLRWVTIHHKIITIAKVRPSWWQKLCYYVAK